MTKQLSLDEMLMAAHDSDMPGRDAFIAQVEQLADLVAAALAEHLGIDGPAGSPYAPGCSFEPGEGGGVLGGFAPRYAGQPVPEVLKKFDVMGDWEPRPVRREAEVG